MKNKLVNYDGKIGRDQEGNEWIYAQFGGFCMSEESINKYLISNSFIPGEFIKRIEITDSISGLIVPTILCGAMFEFKYLYFVVWTDGIYIDKAVFAKG